MKIDYFGNELNIDDTVKSDIKLSEKIGNGVCSVCNGLGYYETYTDRSSETGDQCHNKRLCDCVKNKKYYSGAV
jgi:hypothetical protein